MSSQKSGKILRLGNFSLNQSIHVYINKILIFSIHCCAGNISCHIMNISVAIKCQQTSFASDSDLHRQSLAQFREILGIWRIYQHSRERVGYGCGQTILPPPHVSPHGWWRYIWLQKPYQGASGNYRSLINIGLTNFCSTINKDEHIYRVSQNTRVPSKWPYFCPCNAFFIIYLYRIVLSGPIWRVWMGNFCSKCLLFQDNGYCVLRRTLDNAWEFMIISVVN